MNREQQKRDYEIKQLQACLDNCNLLLSNLWDSLKNEPSYTEIKSKKRLADKAVKERNIIIRKLDKRRQLSFYFKKLKE